MKRYVTVVTALEEEVEVDVEEDVEKDFKRS